MVAARTVADDCFAQPDTHELTIELATPRSCRSPAPGERFATFAIVCSPSIRSPLAVRSGRHAGVTAIGVMQQRRGSRRQAVIVAASPALLPARASRARRRLPCNARQACISRGGAAPVARSPPPNRLCGAEIDRGERGQTTRAASSRPRSTCPASTRGRHRPLSLPREGRARDAERRRSERLRCGDWLRASACRC
jgi:hypothetical protein